MDLIVGTKKPALWGVKRRLKLNTLWESHSTPPAAGLDSLIF